MGLMEEEEVEEECCLQLRLLQKLEVAVRVVIIITIIIRKNIQQNNTGHT